MFTYLVRIAELCSVAERVQLLLGLSHEGVESSFHVWKFFTNVVNQNLVDGVSATSAAGK
jgi:hypothetical protein